MHACLKSTSLNGLEHLNVKLITTIFACSMVMCLLLSGCKKAPAESGTTDGAATSEPHTRAVEQPLFRDATAEVGIDFVHFTGATGKYYMPEIMGPGVGVFDYDNDGDLDIYLVQGGMVMAGDDVSAALFDPPGLPPFRNRLFRNETLTAGATEPGPLRFTDVTEQSGVGDTGYGMGCATADYDNDGFIDIYVTNYGSNALYRNNGDGTFSEVTKSAGVDSPLWSTSAAFGDYDRDGWLDLVVVNYVAFSDDIGKVCKRSGGDQDYCSPLEYASQIDALFHNNGDGTFTEITSQAGLSEAYGSGLGVMWSDFDSDGWLDIYIANDGRPNLLWRNLGDGRFEEIGLLSGTALNESGEAEAGMGLTVEDINDDGHEDIFVTNLFLETNTLYLNRGDGSFNDRTFRLGLGAPSRSSTAFGTAFFDYDRDGYLDLFAVNGGVAKVDSQIGDPYPYLMPNQLFRGDAEGKFAEISAAAGPAFAMLESSRGASLGDFDLDGDVDIVVANNNAPARLILNESTDTHHWIAIELDSGGANRQGIGAQIVLTRSDGVVKRTRIRTDGSYCSSRWAEAWFGLGEAAGPVDVDVRWPDGVTEQWRAMPVDGKHILRRGTGEELP